MASVREEPAKRERRVYPLFEVTAQGVRIRINARVSLPGFYTNQIYAEKALSQYQASGRIKSDVK